jgi:hypothetical protein
VFVCRDLGSDTESLWGNHDRSRSIDQLLEEDRLAMVKAGYKCSRGDLSCLRAGHIAATVVRRLGPTWERHVSLAERMRLVEAEMSAIDIQTDDSED